MHVVQLFERHCCRDLHHRHGLLGLRHCREHHGVLPVIRFFNRNDVPRALEIHKANELPENCFPNLYVLEKGQSLANPLFMVRGVYETAAGEPSMMAFVKITGEVFLLVDHTVGTPEERWEQLKEFKEWVKHEAWLNGLEQLSAWLPPEIEASFGKRMIELGFQKSPWVCYTLNL
jgi:hypothetical protein